MEEIDQMLKDFLWGKRRQEILKLPNILGGLGYPNRTTFDKALKASWSKRIYQKGEGWAFFPIHYGLDKILIFGDIYLSRLKESTVNVFWLDYITSIEDLIVRRQPINFTEAWGVPIWYNSKICHTKIIPGSKEGLGSLVICWTHWDRWKAEKR